MLATLFAGIGSLVERAVSIRSRPPSKASSCWSYGAWTDIELEYAVFQNLPTTILVLCSSIYRYPAATG